MNLLKTIENYQAIEVIGKGANGLVYKGINLTNGCFIAMKEIHLSKAQVKSIKTEISFLKNLHHKNIVNYHDAVIKDHKMYLILEYIEGGSLGALAKRSIFPQNLIKLYIRQTLQGLKFLHESGIIHRDIKGANLLLTKDGKVKIADFGIAVNLNDNQRTLSSAGTPYWMSPQSICKPQQVTTKCDIWALGSTIIELATGNPPYSELAPCPVLIRIVEDQHPPLPSGMSDDCYDFLMKCFEKQPQLRASSAQLLEHRWIKQQNSQKMPDISKSYQIRASNASQIEMALKNNQPQMLLKLIQTMQNSKIIYLNKYFININQMMNSQTKMQILRLIVGQSYEVYSYLQSLAIIKKIFIQECKDPKISISKCLKLGIHVYRLGLQKNVFNSLTNSFLEYIGSTLRQLTTKKQIYQQNHTQIQIITAFLRKILSDQLIIEDHFFYLMGEIGILSSLITSYHFSIDLKIFQISQVILQVLNRFVQISSEEKVCQIFSVGFQKIVNIFISQAHIPTCTENVKLLIQLSRFEVIANKIENSGVITYLSQFIKMLIINKKINQQYFELTQLVLDYLIAFVLPKVERIQQFAKFGGPKRLKSLPPILLSVEAIQIKINKIQTQINQVVK